MPLINRRQALLAKLETTYATDPVPTGAADAIIVRNVQPTPIEVTREARELLRPYLGNSSDVIGARFSRLRFDVEVAGSGTAGTAPKYGPLLRACGMAQVLNAGVSVVYTPISTAPESVTLYLHLDGVLHKFIGARGSVSLRAQYRSAPLFSFDFTGFFVPVTDASLPTATYSLQGTPLAFNKENTPTFALHGVSSAVIRSFSFDLANQVVYRNIINSEVVRIVDRKPTASFEIGAELMAIKNWFNVVANAEQGSMNLVHGTTAGNIVQIGAPAVQLNGITQGDMEGDVMYTASAVLQPSSGNDEISITVR
jgi:hypothetical protein